MKTKGNNGSNGIKNPTQYYQIAVTTVATLQIKQVDFRIFFGVKTGNIKLNAYVNYISLIQLAQDMIQWSIWFLKRWIIY